ncbi:helix-turn-helix transcriptional regulator [Haloechinothrix sp. LS1_15]|uniref:helix-turn-helix domain-containing protein n=1 Tax=Haloechinothrix sp. LS1_15 TaxID=2652248 RepID=UPI0029461B1E|nr:helix-turn-helix transcriptional regulator [Haloechinothrix sp. LS1_15]MDV6014771.1 helix-turn-helix domain-containing protein [Haloechinothrix sp. LS1_15]
MTADDPVVAQIQLGILLRDLREEADLTTSEAGQIIGSSNATISRIENGKQVIKAEDAATLLEAYGADDTQTAEALRLAAVPKPRARRRRSSSYRDAAPNWFTRFLVMESEANEISAYENELVTGLLQTEDYARELLRAGAPLAGSSELDRKVELRMRRQRILTRTDPPPVQLDVILHEATLHRVIGSDEVMARQLQHVLEMSELGNITVRVLPFRPKPTPNHDEAFVASSRFMLLKLPERGTMLYMDDFAGATYPEDLNVIQQYATGYQRLRAAAEDPDASAELIAKITQQYG